VRGGVWLVSAKNDGSSMVENQRITVLVWVAAVAVVIVVLLGPLGREDLGVLQYMGEILAIGLSTLTVGYWLWKRPRATLVLRKALVGWVILTVIGALSIPRALEPAVSVHRVLFLFSAIGLLLAFGVIITKAHAASSLKILLGWMVILASTALYEYFIIGSTTSSGYIRASGMTTNPNILAATMCVSIPMMLSFCMVETKHRVWWIAGVILSSAAVASSYARAGFYILCLLVGIFAIIRDRRILVWMLIVGVLFGLAFPGLYGRVGEGLETVSGNAPKTLNQRVQLWTMGMVMFANNPVSGIGIGNYRTMQNRLISQYPHIDFDIRYRWPHNSLIWAGAELGLLGLLPFCFVMATLLWGALSSLAEANLKERHGTLALGASLSILGMLVYSMADDVFLNVATVYPFWALVASYFRLYGLPSQDAQTQRTSPQ